MIKTEGNLDGAVGRAFKDAGGEVINRGDRVLIKPNLVEPANPESGQITTPGLVAAVARYCLKCGASRVTIGEGPGYYQPSSDPRECFTRTGISEVARKLGIEWVLFDEHEYRTFPAVPDCIPGEFRITEYAFTQDKFINLPVLKAHWLTRVTLAMKNLKGCLKCEDKPLFHRRDLDRAIVALNRLVKPTFNIIDGTPKATTRQLLSGYANWKETKEGLIIAGSDIVAVDAVGSALMGIDPEDVSTITLGAAAGLGEGRLSQIDLSGEEIKQLEFKPKLPHDEIKENFPNLEIKGASKACCGCLLPMLSTLNSLMEQEISSEKKVTIYIGESPTEMGPGISLAIGDCVKAPGRGGGEISGCPPDRNEIRRHLISVLRD